MLTYEDLLNELLGFDRELFADKIEQFIREYVKKSGAKKCVIGLSGGVDSSTVLALTVNAVGAENVIALLLPHSGITPEVDISDALKLADKFGVEHKIIYIDPIASSVKSSLEAQNFGVDKVIYGNIQARTRMILLYAVSNYYNGLVVGSGDKSEILIGYFTKYGDGGVDILPIGDVYKLQVRELARYLGVPENIAYKPSSPRLWPGQEAASELGVDYKDIDPILYALIEHGLPPEEVKKIDGIRTDIVDLIVRRIVTNEHKRQFPKIPKLQKGMTIGIDWKMPLWMSM